LNNWNTEKQILEKTKEKLKKTLEEERKKMDETLKEERKKIEEVCRENEKLKSKLEKKGNIGRRHGRRRIPAVRRICRYCSNPIRVNT
jgi:hypothetical protein